MFFKSKMMSRLRYLKRIFSAYVFSRNSNVSFWNTPLETNSIDDYAQLGKYSCNISQVGHSRQYRSKQTVLTTMPNLGNIT